MRMRNVAAATALVSGMLVAPASASSTEVATEPTPGFSADAGATEVVRGEVLSRTYVDVGGIVTTRTVVEVDQTVTGTAAGTIVVETEGGITDDGLIQVTSHQPELELGAIVELELERATGAGLATANEATSDDSSDQVFRVVGDEEGETVLVEGDEDDLAGEGFHGFAAEQNATNYVLKDYSFDQFPTGVPYVVNPNTSDVAGTGELAAVQAGFQVWENDPFSDINFDYAGSTTVTSRALDGQNAVFWAPGSGFLGRATTWFTADGRVVEFDIHLNSDFAWADLPSGPQFDIRSVVIHESGHALGLGHPPGDESVMFESLFQGATKWNLSTGDLAGIGVKYGIPTCGGQLPTILGTAAGERIDGTNGDDIIFAGAGDDTVYGHGGNDIICGFDGDDTIYGGDGDDTVYGEADDDVLRGGYGNDTLEGGYGIDDAKGEWGVDLVRGGPGNDIVGGGPGDDRVEGGSGNDIVRGGPQNDDLWGNAGDDKLVGQMGEDVLHGGTGRDNLQGNEHDDVLDGGPGNDRLKGNGHRDLLRGGDGDDYLHGGTDVDRLIGGDGNDKLYGAGGDDRIYGGDGNDYAHGGGHDDLIRGEAGDDDVRGGAGEDNVGGGSGHDYVYGFQDDDLLNGNTGNDRLYGGDGDDVVNGGAGADTLYGEAGKDVLHGGDDTDSCLGGAAADKAVFCENELSVP